MEVDIRKLRIFAMLQRAKEINEIAGYSKELITVLYGLRRELRVTEMNVLVLEDTPNLSATFNEFEDIQVMESKNRASRRGFRESKRKNNYNHYS